jgi:hypothetical protein
MIEASRIPLHWSIIAPPSIEDDGRHSGSQVGKLDPEPVDGVAPIDRCRHASSDFHHLGELFQTVGLIGPYEAQESEAAVFAREVDRVQITAAALGNTDVGGRAEEGKMVPPQVQPGARADFEQP